ncbi:MAG TPA: hypothetical protein PK674_02015 [Candidatus Absconditabacterales bacterium]|nr:hypothetical protein [Candidatus Absconditabacterales bacterium]HOQ79142.1 hypothetical protein [Candidatus Absconditabacterales bacterium]HPK28066.1 hypothetical protein [Candidatus Absconditabacterales bacterium]
MFEINDNYIAHTDFIDNNIDEVDSVKGKKIEDNDQKFLKYYKITNDIIKTVSNQTRFSGLGIDISHIGNDVFHNLRNNERDIFEYDEELVVAMVENEITNRLLIEERNRAKQIKTGEVSINKDKEQGNKDKEQGNKDKLEKINTLVGGLKTLYSGLLPELKRTDTQELPDLGNITLNTESITKTEFAQYLFSYNKIQEKRNQGEILTENEEKFMETFKNFTKELGIEIAIAIPINSERPKTVEKKLVVRPTSLENIANSDAILENKRTKGFVAKRLENSSSGKVSLSLDNEKDLSRLPKYAVKKFKEVFLRNKDLFDKYKDFVNDDGTLKNSDDTLLTAIKEYIAQYEEEKKKDILRKIHERAMIGCFRGLTTYFDINSINQENFIKDIKLNINDDITVDEKNKLYIRGSIKGKNIGIYYNMDDGTVEMDDFLTKDENGEFFIGANHGKREKLAFTLPTYDSLVDKGGQIDFSGILKKNDREKDIEEQIDKSLDRTMDSSFKNENINKFFVERHMEEYIAEQEVLDSIFGNRFEGVNYRTATDFRMDDFNIKTNENNRYKLVSMIYNTIEEQKTPSDIRRLRDGINKLNYFIEKAKD